MPSYVPPKKNTQYIFYVSLRDQADVKLFKANPTIAAGDIKVSTDGGALANASAAAVTPAGSALVKITLSAAQMNGDNITVICSDASGAEWCDLVINIQTSARQIDDLAYPTVSGRSMGVDTGGRVSADVKMINASLNPVAYLQDWLDLFEGGEVQLVPDSTSVEIENSYAGDDDTLIGWWIVVYNGTHKQARLITDYAQTNNIVTVARAWDVTPTSWDYLIIPAAGVAYLAEIAADAVDADALASDAVTEIQSGLAQADKLLAYVQLLARSDSAIHGDRVTELGEINNDEGSGAGDYAAADSLENRTEQFTTHEAQVLDRLRAYFQLALRSDAGVATDRSLELGQINADEGSGAGTFDNTDDSQQALSDQLDGVSTFDHTTDNVTVGSLVAAALNSIADAILTFDWTAVTSSISNFSVLNALRYLRNRRYVDGANVLHVRNEDNSADAWSADVTPDASADLITEVDPH